MILSMQMKKPKNLVGGTCKACGGPLIYAGPRRPPGGPRCPSCWPKVAAAQDFTLSLRLAIIAGQLDTVIERVAGQHNTAVLHQLTAANDSLKGLGQQLTQPEWRS